MPRRSNRRRKRETPIMGDIEEQLRLQRLAARVDVPTGGTCTPPARLGNYVYDPSRNAYFPHRDRSDQAEIEIPSMSPRSVPNYRFGSSWLSASELCGNPTERRRIVMQWRGRKLMETLGTSIIHKLADETWKDRLCCPFWHSNFTCLPYRRHGFWSFHQLRQTKTGAPIHNEHRSHLEPCGYLYIRTKTTYCDGGGRGSISVVRRRDGCARGSIKTVCNPEKDDCFVMGRCIHRRTYSQFSYFVETASGDTKCYPFKIPNICIDDFCALTENKWLVVGHSNSPIDEAWRILDGETEAVSFPREPSTSETLCITSFPKSVTQVFSGHRSGQVCLSDLRSNSSNNITIQGGDPDFGNVAKLNVSSTQVIVQASSGCCRLFDIRSQACLLHEFPAPHRPRWTQTSDTFCRGMAVDPTHSILLRPQPGQERGTMTFGLWSLHTGDYLGNKAQLYTNYIELCPIVGRTLLVPHQRAAVWADLGCNGVLEICLERPL